MDAAALLVLDRAPRADGAAARGVVAQLVEGLRQGILEGALRTDDPMPSTRALARELGIARSSVVAAYDQLAGEGYLELRQGAATRVAAIDAQRVDASPRSTASTRPADASAPPARGGSVAAAPPAAAPASGGSDASDAVRIDLSPGVPSTARIDERAWRAAWRTAAAAPPPALSPPPFGVPELRAAIAEHLRHARGVACAADDVVVTAGTSEALALVARALGTALDRAPRIGVEDPGYTGGRRALQLHGAELAPLPLGADGLDVAALASTSARDAGLDAVMVTPSHQYPIGGRLPVAERLALLDWAARTGAVVIEDDYDSEFRHTGAPLPALASLDDQGAGPEHVVLVGSFSKVLTPWLRLGYLVLPRHPALRAAVAAARDDLDSPVAGPVQLAMARLLTGGALRRHIAATRREYRHRRVLVLEALAPLESAGARLRALDGGLHAVLELPDVDGESELVARLAAEGVVVAPLGMYAMDAARDAGRPAGIVIGYAGVGDLALATALGRIAALTRQVLVQLPPPGTDPARSPQPRPTPERITPPG